MDPGGYGVDLLRSCYETKFAFTEGGPEYDIRWYFTKPDTLVLPISTTFNSRNWSKQLLPWPLVGEVEGAERIYSKGTPPAQMPTYRLIGSDDDFFDGQDAVEPGYEVNPACEILYPQPPAGGVEVGGDASLMVNPWLTAACPGGITKANRLWFRQFADPNPALPLYFDLTWIPLFNFEIARWLFAGDEYVFVLFRSAATNNFHVSYFAGGIAINTFTPSNVKNCAHWIGLYTPTLLPPAVPDPFAFYLYDIWAQPSIDPKPF